MQIVLGHKTLIRTYMLTNSDTVAMTSQTSMRMVRPALDQSVPMHSMHSKSSISFLFHLCVVTVRNYKYKRTSNTQLHEKHIQLCGFWPLPMSYVILYSQLNSGDAQGLLQVVSVHSRPAGKNLLAGPPGFMLEKPR